MEANKKTISAGIVGSILLTLSILGSVNYLTDDDAYVCLDRGITMNCDSLSKYYGLDNGKCYNSEIGNKLCRSGWLEVVDDQEIVITNSGRAPGALQYKCSVEGCSRL